MQQLGALARQRFELCCWLLTSLPLAESAHVELLLLLPTELSWKGNPRSG
jgi:hypothetical protein